LVEEGTIPAEAALAKSASSESSGAQHDRGKHEGFTAAEAEFFQQQGFGMASDGHAVECLLEETDAPQTPRRLPQAEVDPYFIWNGEVACEDPYLMLESETDPCDEETEQNLQQELSMEGVASQPDFKILDHNDMTDGVCASSETIHAGEGVIRPLPWKAAGTTAPPCLGHGATGQPSGSAEARTRSRSRSPIRPLGDNKPSPRKASRMGMVFLDGLNILRSRNHQSLRGGEMPLEWSQLEAACQFFASRGCKVAVFLPHLRASATNESELRRLCELFGEVVVRCPGRNASDDLFMINTVKVTEGEQLPCEEPQSYIVTNDYFRDWVARGDVDEAWVERHCVHFTFGPSGFVPSKLP